MIFTPSLPPISPHNNSHSSGHLPLCPGWPGTARWELISTNGHYLPWVADNAQVWNSCLGVSQWSLQSLPARPVRPERRPLLHRRKAVPPEYPSEAGEKTGAVSCDDCRKERRVHLRYPCLIHSHSWAETVQEKMVFFLLVGQCDHFVKYRVGIVVWRQTATSVNKRWVPKCFDKAVGC